MFDLIPFKNEVYGPADQHLALLPAYAILIANIFRFLREWGPKYTKKLCQ